MFNEKRIFYSNTIVAEENYSSSATISSNTLIKSWIFWIRTFLSKIVFFRFTDKDSNFFPYFRSNIRHVSHLVDRIGKKGKDLYSFPAKSKRKFIQIFTNGNENRYNIVQSRVAFSGTL